MTREEAIRIIKIVLAIAEDFEITVQGEEFTEEKCKEAVEMATKALEQEPSGDLISRQAVIDALYDIEVIKYRIDIENVIKALPPVKPQPCKDAISRQALLDDLGMTEKTRKYGGDHSGYNTMMLYEIQDVIESQPPV